MHLLLEVALDAHKPHMLFCVCSCGSLFSQDFQLFGYARSKMTDDEFRTLIGSTLTCRIDARCVRLGPLCRVAGVTAVWGLCTASVLQL